jgi:hypothetical protein
MHDRLFTLTPAARLRAELAYLRGQIEAHRTGPPPWPRRTASLVGAALGLLTACSLHC